MASNSKTNHDEDKLNPEEAQPHSNTNTNTTSYVISPVPDTARRISNDTEETNTTADVVESHTTELSFGFSLESSGRTLSSTQLLLIGCKLSSRSVPVLGATLSESVHELKARACKSAPEVRFDPGGSTRIDTPSDGVISSSRVRNRKLARKDNHRQKSPRVISRHAEGSDDNPTLSIELSQDWSQVGDLPSFPTRSHARTGAGSLAGASSRPPTPSQNAEATPGRNARVYSYRKLADDDGPISPWENDTRMSDISLDDISSDSALLRLNDTLSEVEEANGLFHQDGWSWSELSEEATITTSSSSSQVRDYRKTKSEPGVKLRKKIHSIHSHSRKVQSLPDLGDFSTPNLSELEFAHMMSRDEGDVGDIYSSTSSDDDDDENSDTLAEVGSASTDNQSLPELDDDLEEDDAMSSWSDLSLIIEGISVHRHYDAYKPYLLTQMSAQPRTQSAAPYRHPLPREMRLMRRSVSDSMIQNKYSERYYKDCIGLETRSIDRVHSLVKSDTQQTFSINDGAFMTELQHPPTPSPLLRTAGAGGGYDPDSPSSSSDDDIDMELLKKAIIPGSIRPRRKPEKNSPDMQKYTKVDRTVQRKVSWNSENGDMGPFNGKSDCDSFGISRTFRGWFRTSARVDPPPVRHWRKPQQRFGGVTDLMVIASAELLPKGNFQNHLPILPAIAPSRSKAFATGIENIISVGAINAFKGCFPLERNSLLNRYLKDMAWMESFFSIATEEAIDKSSSNISLRIKPSYGTVTTYDPLVTAMHLRPASPQPIIKNEGSDNKQQVIRERQLLRCQRIESMLRMNSEIRSRGKPAYQEGTSEETRYPFRSKLVSRSRRRESTRSYTQQGAATFQPQLANVTQPLSRPNSPANMTRQKGRRLSPLTSSRLKSKLENHFNIHEVVTAEDPMSRAHMLKLNIDSSDLAANLFIPRQKPKRTPRKLKPDKG